MCERPKRLGRLVCDPLVMLRLASLTMLSSLFAFACGSTDAAPDAQEEIQADASSTIADANTPTPDAVTFDATPAFDAAPTEFNAAFCAQVEGTLNIHWEAVGGSSAPCTGIETTDGVVADATASGSIIMSGVSVSNDQCIATAAYDLVLSNDTLSLTGSDTDSSIAMTLTRQPSEACFVGHWIDGNEDYVGHLSAAAFGISLK